MNGKAELEAAVEALTTNETYFFREPNELRAFSEDSSGAGGAQRGENAIPARLVRGLLDGRGVLHAGHPDQAIGLVSGLGRRGVWRVEHVGKVLMAAAAKRRCRALCAASHQAMS